MDQSEIVFEDLFENKPEPPPEQRLWLALIILTLRDAKKNSSIAIMWLLGNTKEQIKDRELVCLYAGVDSELLKEHCINYGMKLRR